MKIWSGFFTFALILILAGCGGISEKEMKTQARQNAAKSFEAKPEKPNEKMESGSFYMPSGFSISSKKKNNAILKKNQNEFLLFINTKERKDSKESYRLLKKEYKNRLVDQTFEEGGEFGYLLLYKLKKNEYEITCGVGGNKLTSILKREAVPAAASEMMKVLKSIR
ncbi:hypothetical protein CEF21_17585 [Bacillus sp. FJAT-42376]|uniref:hypothetical protein n=1 Tax=Bacillus sp. FJAT-42376 TaxID=2014076 RepID=UPI000F4FCA2F|nr:hypothetical protein [Bacillus sp. FJAT-42376]AZB43981.1 hypothetical protein CEF21_17585 [Bacillus sp. FJAT-42376]